MAGIIGYSAEGVNHHGRADYFIQLNWLDQVTMTADGVLGDGKLYTRLYGGPGTVEYKMYVYEIGATDALSPLVASSSTVQSTSETYQWLTIPFPNIVILESGKKYAVAFCQRSVTGGGVTPYFKFDGELSGTHRICDNGSFDAPSNLTTFGPVSNNTRYSAYVEYGDPVDYDDDTAGSFSILAPVEPYPILTSGQTPTYATGHEPDYAVDGNLNTYWEPSGYTDDSIWFDLGAATPVYAIVIWLHNYNESWGSPKSWQISYSSDDVTYSSFDDKLFDDYRDVSGPILVDVLPMAFSARYWKITFKNFDDYPKTHKVQIGNVWFVLPYYMPTRRVLPATDINSYVFDNMEDATHRAVTYNYYRQRRLIMPVNLLLTSQTDVNRLESMYEASRYGARPIFCKPRQNDSRWRIMNVSSYSIARNEGGIWRANLRLEDFGHRLVERYNHIHRQHPETIGSWHFNEDLTDDSDVGNDLTTDNIVSGDYIHGVDLYGKTAVTMYDGAQNLAYISSGSAGDFDMGMSDFTVELTLLVTTVSGDSNFVSKAKDAEPIEGWKIKGYHTGGELYLRVDLSDGTNHIYNSTAGTKNIGDNAWHYIAVVVDRTADLLKMYIDSVQYGGDVDISSITGNISAPTYSFIIRADANTYTAFDLVEVTKRAFTLAEIEERAIGSHSIGTWRI